MAVGSMPLNWTSVIHHGTYELVQRQSVPDGEIAAPIQKRTEYPESLGCSSSNLVEVCSPGKFLIKGDPKIFDFFDPLNLVSKKPEWSRCKGFKPGILGTETSDRYSTNQEVAGGASDIPDFTNSLLIPFGVHMYSTTRGHP